MLGLSVNGLRHQLSGRRRVSRQTTLVIEHVDALNRPRDMSPPSERVPKMLFIAVTASGESRIGSSSKPEDRVRVIAVEEHLPELTLYRAFEHTHCERIEALLWYHLKEYRLGGRKGWYGLSGEDAVRAIEEAITLGEQIWDREPQGTGLSPVARDGQELPEPGTALGSKERAQARDARLDWVLKNAVEH